MCIIVTDNNTRRMGIINVSFMSMNSACEVDIVIRMMDHIDSLNMSSRIKKPMLYENNTLLIICHFVHCVCSGIQLQS